MVRHDRVDSSEHSPWRFGRMGIVTPNFVIRQLEDSSAAVRTPTFNPKLTYQVYWLRKAADAGVTTNVNKWRHTDLRLLDFQFAHYSNGQSGCFYTQQRFVLVGDDYECQWVNNDSSTRTINYSDGSFSTWYGRLGVGGERMWGFGEDDAPASSHVGAFATVQYFIPFMTEEPQKPLYGNTRLSLSAEYEKWSRCFGGLNWQTNGLWDKIFFADAATPTSRWLLETSLSSDYLLGFGLFLRRHEGQDYYNIAFTKRLSVWQYGVIFKMDRRDVFPR